MRILLVLFLFFPTACSAFYKNADNCIKKEYQKNFKEKNFSLVSTHRYCWFLNYEKNKLILEKKIKRKKRIRKIRRKIMLMRLIRRRR